MDIGLAATTFAVVIPAELPDKTFVSAVVLGSRHRFLPVWCGGAAALVLQAGVATELGRAVSLLPHRVVDAVVAALFLVGALAMARRPDSDERRPDPDDQVGGRDEVVAPEPTASAIKIAATTFAVVALAELGDLTQVVVANLAARERDVLSVFVGASVAFVLVSAVGVFAGRTLVRVVPLTLVRRVSAAMFAALAIWSALGAAGA